MTPHSASGGESALKAGTLVAARYRIERLVGRGGTALVYAARDTRREGAGETTGLDVAIKVLRSDLVNTISRDRFVREVELVLTLSHPNVLPVLDAGFDGDIVYCVMPLVRGRTLAARLARDRQLTVAEAARIVTAVAGALGAAHDEGIVHRDVKPENILLEDEQVWLADFGIARAILSAGGERLTLSGIAVGTPMYMSPEQAGGTAVLDGRSDQYSLACVAYEALAGVPPFRGATPQVVAQQRLVAPPQDIRHLRPELSDAVVEVMAKALSATPAERYETVVGYAAALNRAVALGTRGTPMARGVAGRARSWTIATIALAAPVTLGLVVWFAGSGMRRVAPVVDVASIAVLPFAEEGSVRAAMSGELAARLAQEALTRWDGLKIVSELRVREAAGVLAQRAGADERLQIARREGAGRMLWGSVWQLGDTLHIRASVYDVVSGTILRQQAMHLHASLVDAGARFNGLADSLVVAMMVGTPSARDGAAGTSNVSALAAYDHGHAALLKWNLDSAGAWFARASAADSNYAQAHLWLAQVLSWSAPVSAESDPAMRARWREAARSASARRARLSLRERSLAEALLALAEERYPEACAVFDRWSRLDSADFAAWYGAGDCRRRDALVIREAGGGWRFRSSFHTAFLAYSRALRLVPSLSLAMRGVALRRLPDVLMVDASSVRWGRSTDGKRFASTPGLVADTMSFTPLPMEQFMGGGRETIPPTADSARARARRLYRDIAATWASGAPQNADAHEAYAQALELTGQLEHLGTLPSAERELQVVHALSSDDAQRLRATVALVRVRLKAGAVIAAIALADSAVRAHLDATGDPAADLASLAVLVGRPAQAARLLVRSNSLPTTLTSTERTAYATGIAFAAVGAPRDDVRRAFDDAFRLVRNVDANRTLCIAAALAFQATGPTPQHGAASCGADAHLEAQRRVAAGDRPGARAVLARIWRERGDSLAAVTMDFVAIESDLLLAIGDTVGARRRVTSALARLDREGLYVVGQPLLAGGLRRTLALAGDRLPAVARVPPLTGSATTPWWPH